MLGKLHCGAFRVLVTQFPTPVFFLVAACAVLAWAGQSRVLFGPFSWFSPGNPARCFAGDRSAFGGNRLRGSWRPWRCSRDGRRGRCRCRPPVNQLPSSCPCFACEWTNWSRIRWFQIFHSSPSQRRIDLGGVIVVIHVAGRWAALLSQSTPRCSAGSSRFQPRYMRESRPMATVASAAGVGGLIAVECAAVALHAVEKVLSPCGLRVPLDGEIGHQAAFQRHQFPAEDRGVPLFARLVAPAAAFGVLGESEGISKAALAAGSSFRSPVMA